MRAAFTKVVVVVVLVLLVALHLELLLDRVVLASHHQLLALLSLVQVVAAAVCLEAELEALVALGVAEQVTETDHSLV